MFFLGAETLVDDTNAFPPSYLRFPHYFRAKLCYRSFYLYAVLIPTFAHLQMHPPQASAPRTEALLRSRRVALPLAVTCPAIAQAFGF